MLLSQIKGLLDRTLSIEEFRKYTEGEIGEYKRLLAKKGSTVPINCREDISYHFTIGNYDDLSILLATNKLTNYEVSYICDALTLSENVTLENDDLFDQLEYFVLEK